MSVVSLLLAGLSLATADPLVTLRQGRLRGVEQRTDNGDISNFLGIPYAEPPIGQRRFRSPQRHGGWGNGEFTATEHGPACMQDKDKLSGIVDRETLDRMETSEDCLYLNVYVPGVSIEEEAGYPVVVWIHGGKLEYGSAEILGSSSMNCPKVFVASSRVIVVTFNYRLNVFGFLAIPEGEDANPESGAPGNAGLLDQNMALRWVHENIRKFGGDPKKVTLMGDEKGAASVSLHVMHPGSAGLFQRAASSSWTYTSAQVPCKKDGKVRMFWKDFAAGLGCTSDVTAELLTCLQEKESLDLIQNLPHMYPKVIVDGTFLKDQPKNLWKRGDFNPVDYLLGVNVEDGDFILRKDPEMSEKLREGYDDEDVEKVLCMLKYLGYPSGSTATGRYIQKIIRALYFDEEQGDLANLRSSLNLARDAFVLAPIAGMAYQLCEAGAKVYLYCFSEQSSANRERYGEARLALGAGGGTQLDYILPTPRQRERMRGDELSLATSMMEAWSSFAKTGDPMFLTDDREEYSWPPYKKYDSKFLEFQSPMSESSVRSGFARNVSIIWNKLLPAFSKMMEMKAKKQQTMALAGDGGKADGTKDGRRGMGWKKGDWDDMWDWEEEEDDEEEDSREENEDGVSAQSNVKWMGDESQGRVLVYVIVAMSAVSIFLLLCLFVVTCMAWRAAKRDTTTVKYIK